MKINGIEIKAQEFAFDKAINTIYLIETPEDKAQAKTAGYTIWDIQNLLWAYTSSLCFLRSISTWSLNEIAPRGEDARFE